MNNGPKRNSIFSLVFLVLLNLFLFSCSQNNFGIRNGTITFVIDYSQADVRSNRLSVFFETANDSRLYSNMTLSCENSDFYWNTNELLNFANGEKIFTGNSNFVMAQNRIFPNGTYKIQLNTYDEQTVEFSKLFNYDTSIYSKNKEELIQYFINRNALQKIAVYDANMKLIYFDEFKKEEDEKRQIWNRFPDAKTYNQVLMLEDQTLMLILPSEKIEVIKKEE